MEDSSGPGERIAMQVNLTPDARRVVDGVKEELGVTKQQAVERILQWWATQPESVRKEVVYGGDAGAELARLALAAAGAAGDSAGGPPLTMGQAVQSIRALLDRIEHIDAERRREFGGGDEPARKGGNSSKRGKSS